MADPAAPASDRGDLKSTSYEFFMLAMAILSIVNLALLLVFPFESQYWYLVGMIEVALTLVFVGDFAYRLKTATSRWGYFAHQQGFLDLLSCVPALRIFRLFRILRAVRITRRLGGPRVLRELRQELASGALYLIVVVGITTLEVVGLLELRFEQNASGANITTAGDALWWGYVTATTVGYGDYYPVTAGGRISALIMLTVGVGLFATFSGFLASTFLSPRKRQPPPPATPQIAEIRALVEQQEATVAELRAKLEQLEYA
ncbi:MAG TPA: ion transporter [Gaiellaceae bacterium]|nr:ion transporter [Gaiellaceae bacterium]